MFMRYLHYFHPIWVLGAEGGEGALKGLVQNNSKIEGFETCFFDIVIT